MRHTTTSTHLAAAATRWRRIAMGCLVATIFCLYGGGLALMLGGPGPGIALGVTACSAGIGALLADHRADTLHRQCLRIFLFDAVDDVSAGWPEAGDILPGDEP